MLTVASPPADELEIQIRAQSIEKAIRMHARRAVDPSLKPVAIVYSFPLALSRITHGADHRGLSPARGSSWNFETDFAGVSAPASSA